MRDSTYLLFWVHPCKKAHQMIGHDGRTWNQFSAQTHSDIHFKNGCQHEYLGTWPRSDDENVDQWQIRKRSRFSRVQRRTSKSISRHQNSFIDLPQIRRGHSISGIHGTKETNFKTSPVLDDPARAREAPWQTFLFCSSERSAYPCTNPACARRRLRKSLRAFSV